MQVRLWPHGSNLLPDQYGVPAVPDPLLHSGGDESERLL
jgi:hypothetical protein